MNKQEITNFFNKCAVTWDSEMIKDQEVVDFILDNAGIKAGCDVLDVACGTGVLIPDYLARGVGSVVAVDISCEMINIARSKFPQKNVTFVCADVLEYDPQLKFDRIMVYNAFPHFPNPNALIEKLSSQLRDGGILTVAHGMSREQINDCHKGSASKISMGLLHEDELAKIMSASLDIITKISDQRMYQVSGRKPYSN